MESDHFRFSLISCDSCGTEMFVLNTTLGMPTFTRLHEKKARKIAKKMGVRFIDIDREKNCVCGKKIEITEPREVANLVESD